MSMLSALIPAILITGLSLLVHRWLWLRLVRDAAFPEPWNRLFTAAFGLLALGMPAGMIATFLLPRGSAGPVAWAVYLWMGWLFLLMTLTIPLELVRLGWWTRRRLTHALPSPERRQLVARVLSVGVGAVGAGATAFGVGRATGAVPVRQVRIPVKGLSPGLSGFRIALLTDVHVGPTIRRPFVERLVEQTNALEPDLIAVTGDLVDGSVANLGDDVRPFENLRAKHGVYFVTGNHEYISGVEEWLRFLPTLGWRVLQNERVRLDLPGGALDVAGVNDYSAGRQGPAHAPNLPRALEGRDPAVPVLLLAHQPRAADEAARLGVNVQLSGHTHDGQIWPFRYAVRLTTPYVVGLHTVGDLQLYVSPGTGYWGPPMRVGTQAEITEVELVPA